MNKILLTFLFISLFRLAGFSQSPQGFQYQAILRDPAGLILANTPAFVQISILQGSSTSPAIYTETHSDTTNAFGLVNLRIGQGTATLDTFSTIDWSLGSYFVQVSVNGIEMGTSPLLSVPFALYAQKGGTPGPQGIPGPQGLKGDTGSFPAGNAVGDMQYWDGNQWVMIPIGQSGSSLKNCEGQLTWSACKPSLTTLNPSSVSTSGIAIGGNVFKDGDAPVTVRGMCWSTSPEPTIANSKTSDGSGLGTFTRTISGLSLGTTYYVRAYATNSVGTSYGNQITATTATSTIPTVVTTAVTLIDGNSANSGGNVTSNGGATVTSRGIVWDTVAGPTIGLTTKTVNGSGNGVFTSNMTGLTINTLYYVRAYATNSAGTGYGNQLTFTSSLFTVGGGVTDIDGNAYNSIIIGAQEWMKENLKVSKYRNGDAIPTGLDDAAWAATTNGAFSIYNNSAGNNTTYGKLYNFYAVADPRGLCPAGWHEPTDNEWAIFTDSLGGLAVAGGKMKTTSGWALPNTGATNVSGFSALPAGTRNNNGAYGGLTADAFWWTATQFNATQGWDRTVKYNATGAASSSDEKAGGFSVRCLKD